MNEYTNVNTCLYIGGGPQAKRRGTAAEERGKASEENKRGRIRTEKQ